MLGVSLRVLLQAGPHAERYVVFLSTDVNAPVIWMMKNRTAAAEQLTHARILLKADGSTAPEGGWSDEAIEQLFDVSIATIVRVRRRYVRQGLAAALQRQARHRVRRRHWMARPGPLDCLDV